MGTQNAAANRKHQRNWYERQKNWDGVIYKITCIPEDSVYVGSTKNSLKKRWWHHKALANQGKAGRLYDWLRLWISDELGDTMFQMEELEQVNEGESIQSREAYWIQKLDADCNTNLKKYIESRTK